MIKSGDIPDYAVWVSIRGEGSAAPARNFSQ